MTVSDAILRMVRKYGGTLSTGGDWRRSCGMDQGPALALAGELRSRHYQVREPVQAKDKTWEVQFR